MGFTSTVNVDISDRRHIDATVIQRVRKNVVPIVECQALFLDVETLNLVQ
ncbi:hypothetical protein [Paraburkholderia sp. SIMBA_054]